METVNVTAADKLFNLDYQKVKQKTSIYNQVLYMLQKVQRIN